jgi:uncharacterized membrane protein YkoI
MKTKLRIITVVAAFTLAGLTTATLLAAGEETETLLQAQARITKAEAEKTALAKVPNGTIKSGELEKEHGKLVWSFDVSTPHSKNITEVQVDAKTGKIVVVEKETPKASGEGKSRRQEREEIAVENRSR